MKTFNFIVIFIFLGIIITAYQSKLSADLEKGLISHWPLSGNTQDISGNERHAVINGALDLNAGGPDGTMNSAAGFNGYNAWLEIPPEKSPLFGKDDFSIAVWINSDTRHGDVPGDIISQYDPISHKGFHLSLKSNAITTSYANERQIHFGIDNNQMTKWTDCGRPGKAICAFSLASYKGKLYAGTCESGKDESGHVYCYNGENKWIDCGSPDRSNSVMALALFNGELYAGTGKYRLAGSALPESENLQSGGRIFRYEGQNHWVDCGQLPATEVIGGLVVYRGALYASSMYSPAGFYRYEGDTKWVNCGTPGGKRVVALGVYNGYIYASSYDGSYVFRYDGTSWTECGLLADSGQTYSFIVYQGRLYVGTWPKGRVYRFEDINNWTDIGRLGNELEVMGMLVHNGRLIAGTLPLAEVYSYEGDTIWRNIGRLDYTPDVKYRRAWTMVEHDGKVFCSTLPSGKIFSFEAGRNIICPDPMKEGWHHIVAVKSKDRLILYIDGKESAKSGLFDSLTYNLDSRIPLRIGFGANDYFSGQMADLRLYNRQLNNSEIRLLSDPENISASKNR